MRKSQGYVIFLCLTFIFFASDSGISWGQGRLTPALQGNQKSVPGSAAKAMAAGTGGLVASGTSASAPTENSGESSVAPSAQEQSKLPAEIQKQLELALEKFKTSDIPGTLELLRAVYKSNPQAIQPPRLYLASWFAQLKNTKAVRVSLELATEETPDDPEAYLLLGEIAYAQGELTGAELLFNKAEALLQESKTNAERLKALQIKLYRDKVKLSQSRSRWDAMQGALGALIKLEGETAETAQGVALSFFHKNEDESAQKWLVHAEGLAKGKGLPADAVMSQFYLGRGDAAKAKTSLAAALQKHPNNPDVLALSVMMALNENDLAAAGQYADQLLKGNPDSVGIMKTCANVALFRGDFARAEQIFQEALKKSPNDTEITNGLALALVEQNVPEKTKLALQYAAGNVQKQNNNRNFLSTLGWTLYKAGDKSKAREVLQHSAADGQLNPASAYYMAVILSEDGKKEEAKKLLQAVVNVKAPFFKRAAAAELLGQLSK